MRRFPAPSRYQRFAGQMYAILGGRFRGSNHFLTKAAMRDDAARNSGQIGDDIIDDQALSGEQGHDVTRLTLADFR